MKIVFYLLTSFLLLPGNLLYAQDLKVYNPVWTSMSENSSESMPLGGGDIGLNVWVENGDLLFYFSRSGTFDEHNTFLKLGRVRMKLSPNPFKTNGHFRQELDLEKGSIHIEAGEGNRKTAIDLWVDVFQPVIHVEVESAQKINLEAAYESWRYKNRPVKGAANNANSYKWAPQGETITFQDSIQFSNSGVLFYHHNRDENTVFDVAVRQQGMETVKDQMMDPIGNLTFGGWIKGDNLEPSGNQQGVYQDTDFKSWKLASQEPAQKHSLEIYLHTKQTPDQDTWQSGLDSLIQNQVRSTKYAKANTQAWWKTYWEKSYLITDPGNKMENDTVWQIGKNYQLFRYMLGCNAYGSYPTKFNGGLFTVDPVHTKEDMPFTPDHRNWGGGTMTAQNQRLVYFPMVRTGDFDMMKPQFDFYLRSWKIAKLRSQLYWGHDGASFTEQLENFGLPNPAEYGWDRPEDYDPGMQYNAWLEYQWDTVLEFCKMMLETEKYSGKSIKEYLPFIESCLRFFDEHYQYLAENRGAKTLDQNGDLVLYPGSANETYKMAYNATSTIAGLRTILESLLELPYLDSTQVNHWEGMLDRLPPLSYREIDGHKVIAPAKLWERVNNTETPQLYPVYPWGIYGLGRPDLQTAINTYQYDPDALEFRSHVGWKQDNIFAARMGLTEEAARLTLKKMGDSGRRFPAFWGPGFDWVPDHNWGGSGMIGMQEMLLQTDDQKIYLFPAWPKNWDVQFKLHAPYQTTIEGELKDGQLKSLKVTPKEREMDVVNLLGWSLQEKIMLGE
ncbi:DUF5703 domain-containing protein [Echinicola jeungdonensis]|uniref:DUF5703 domain-containing protein n=1 Tax=Echinicola jeungdonensis TaxID=709343 RepID=A0ABV5J568_9BACT|nr:DUF5703 domain-containing protein [Echinicola jeungdonensis]MDN3668650.1 DUF5703 domain-containing protein [Echinicola jeungdonensis]